MSKRIQIRFTMDFEVDDVEAFLAAANAQAKKDGSDMVFDKDDLTGAACMLLDPGYVDGAGISIDGSDAELVGAIFNDNEEDDL